MFLFECRSISFGSKLLDSFHLLLYLFKGKVEVNFFSFENSPKHSNVISQCITKGWSADFKKLLEESERINELTDFEQTKKGKIIVIQKEKYQRSKL